MALLELQSEGNGARKKRKVWTAKENIRDAAWKSVSGLEFYAQGKDNVEVTGGDTAASEEQVGSKSDLLRFIPRKRTNTDHVITPRKPLRQTYLNSDAQTLEVGSGVTLREKPPRRKKSIRRSIRQSTGTKTAGTSLFSAGNGAVPSLAANIDINSHMGAIQQQRDTTSETMITIESSAVGNRPAEEAESGQPLVAQGVFGNVEMSMDSYMLSTAKDTDSPKKRKRSSIRRHSRRCTRSSTTMQGITEEPSAENKSTADNTEIGLPTNQDLQNNLEQNVISGDNTARAAHDISIKASVEETQGRLRLSSINEAVKKQSSIEDRVVQTTPRESLQPEILSVNSINMLRQTQPTKLSANSSPDGLGNTVAEELIQPEPNKVQMSAIGKETFPQARKALEHDQSERAEAIASPDSPSDEKSPADPLPVSHLVNASVEAPFSQTTSEAPGSVADLEPSMQIPAEDISTLEIINVAAEELPQSPSEDPSISEPSQALPESAPSFSYEDDDADMLRKFLTRVKANKAAKAENVTPQRKRSLPHSPLRLPLGELDTNNSPSPLSLKPNDELEASDPSPSPKRRKRHELATDAEDEGKLKAIRRSGRTRLPVKSAAPGAPSLIPVRRLGKDGDATVTLRSNEEKELAALTRVNTRKNKGSLNPTEVLLLKMAEKTDPVLKQRLLKEMFEEKKKNGKNSEKGKSVAWAEELTQFQSEKEHKDKEKVTAGSSSELKKSSVRVGAAVRNKIALGKPVNGTPGPKRMRERT